jgi:hypothetical protein
VNQLPTPAANWLAEGRPDPHAGQYDGDRHTLALGQLTDDELANALFLGGNEPLNIERVMSKDPNYFPAIGLLTAGKDRIRWLSRKLTAAELQRDNYRAVLEGAAYGEVDGIGTNTPADSRALGEEVMRGTLAIIAQRDDLLAALTSLVLFTKPSLTNAAALNNAHQAIAKATGGAV